MTVLSICFLKIHNMSTIVDQLESYDQSNLEVIRIEFAKLQKKLEKCRDEQDDFSNAQIGNADSFFRGHEEPFCNKNKCFLLQIKRAELGLPPGRAESGQQPSWLHNCFLIGWYV